METLKFLTAQQANEVAEKFSTPCYVYSQEAIENQCKKAHAFPNSFGIRVRFAMKSCPTKSIVQLIDSLGMHIDASSGYEVERAIEIGIAPEKISLSSQEVPNNFKELILKNIHFNACSLHQIESYGKLFPNTSLGVRINPGLGSGGTNRTNVGGEASSFGIWHEYIPQILALCEKYNLKVIRIHTHIGSGSDPKVWQKVAKMSLDTVRKFKDVTILNMGGGFKVGRMSDETSTDLTEIGTPIANEIENFANETGRKLEFEIEPGTFIMANSASVVTTIRDICDTGKNGYKFLKLDSGMNEVLRPSIYGARHPLIVLQKEISDEKENYIVVGRCCESGDILTPKAGDPEALEPRLLAKATIGDLCVIDSCGAYCSAMGTKNYNSYPVAAEVLLEKSGDLKLIRRRQTLDQIIQDEL